MNRFAYRMAGSLLLCAWWGWAASGAEAPPAPAGIDARRWSRVCDQVMARTPSDGQAVPACLVLVLEGETLGLPAEPILARIEEGLAKEASLVALESAARQRLTALRQAKELLDTAGYVASTPPRDALLRAVARAAENGLPLATLGQVLTYGRGADCDRLRTIVETGEWLRLSGVDDDQVAVLLQDFAERNLRRMEILRAGRWALQQHRSGQEPARIRQQLWDAGGSAERRAGGGASPGVAPAGSGTGSAGSGGHDNPARRGR